MPGTSPGMTADGPLSPHKMGLRGPGFIGSVPPQAVPQIPVICDKIAHNGAIG